MGDFARIREQDGQIDYVNRDAVARVYAEQISAQDWVVKVVLVGGLEIIDCRTKSEPDAVSRVADIIDQPVG